MMATTAQTSLSRLLATWDPIDTDWPDIVDRPPEPVEVGEP
jgi:hypothetical protein